MPKNNQSLQLDQSQTKQLIDGYMQYRFRQVLSPQDLAKKAGVKPEVTARVLAQQPVDDADLIRVANLLGMSTGLLRQICGLEPMPREMLDTINGFLAHNEPRERAREARG